MADLPAWLRRLSLRHLEILLAIRRTGSLSRAAAVMASTQPGLSKWLRELEDDLGAPLFERTTRRLAPTAMGEAVLRHAERVVGEAERTREEIRAVQEGGLGWVQLGVLPGLAPVLVPPAIRWLRERNLGIHVRLRESTLDVLLPQLREHRMDLLVARLDRVARNAGLPTRTLFTEDVAVLASASHRLQSRVRLRWSDVAAEPWVLPVAGSPMRDTLDNAFAQAGLPTPPPLLESASPLTNRVMALDAGCLFLTSRHIAATLESGGALRRLPLRFAGVPTDVGVMWASATLSPQQAHVMAALEAAAASLHD